MTPHVFRDLRGIIWKERVNDRVTSFESLCVAECCLEITRYNKLHTYQCIWFIFVVPINVKFVDERIINNNTQKRPVVHLWGGGRERHVASIRTTFHK